jgi:oligoendopeptidase F
MAETQTLSALPHWDMTSIYPALDSSEFETAYNALLADISELGKQFDAWGVRKRDTPQVDAEFLAAFEQATNAFNAISTKLWTIGSYIGCFVSVNAEDELAQSRESHLNAQLVPLDQLDTRYTAWVGSSDVDALLAASSVARDHEYALRKAQREFQHQMTEAEEALASELRPSSITAWARLHGNVAALLTAPVVINGETQVLPMSKIRALANDPDRAVRKAAFEAELATWETVKVPMAAALNGVKGFQNTLRRKRRYSDDIEPTLYNNSIDAATLEAMQSACVKSFPDFRRYMDAKARALGLEKLAWYDISAPVGESTRKYSWEEAEAFIRTNFARYSKKLADFADHTFTHRWIDAEPRKGKEGGAFCTDLLGAEESRVLLNFDGSFSQISTLAHELGHAYHNLNLRGRTPMQRSTPMTLAETASIFCETLAFDAALAESDEAERLALLDTALEGKLMVVVDIHSRFLFEKGVFERRQERELTAAEFSQLMTDAQKATYGDNLDPLHPFMWAVKGHYYGPTFYNYPYTFGLLFGLGLYARYQQEPEPFRARYDDLLSSTGLADARTLANRFGIDIADEAFWTASLDIVRSQIAEFETLVK